MAILAARARWLAIGLALLLGIGIYAARTTAPAALPVTDGPTCDSCDARHARLADLRAQATDETE
jgi:hypothetical protein